MAAISWALGGDKTNATLEKLGKVARVEEMIEEAKTQEEKLQILEAQRQQLTHIIEVESRRQSLIFTKNSLEEQAVRILGELDSINSELISIEENVSSNPAIEEIRRLQNRLQSRSKGDVVLRIRGQYYTIERDVILALPFGHLLLSYFHMCKIAVPFFNNLIKKSVGV